MNVLFHSYQNRTPPPGQDCFLGISRPGSGTVYLAIVGQKSVPLPVRVGDTLTWITHTGVVGPSTVISNGLTDLWIVGDSWGGSNPAFRYAHNPNTEISALQSAAFSKANMAALFLLVGLAIWASWQRARR